MMDYGWRTVVIQSQSRLTIKDGQMSVYDVPAEEEHLIPIEEIRRVIVSVPSGIVSFHLLQRLIEANVSVVFCDRKHIPSGEITPIGIREESSGCIIDQTCWTQERKDTLWKEIVVQKITNQIGVLEKCDKEIPTVLVEYLNNVGAGDPTNREAMAAKVYFHALFGMNFGRHSNDIRNTALNYGYALLSSTAARTVSMHGYHNALGIHHHSRNNKLNLACVIMEPFRPFVDLVVSKNGKRRLDNAFKLELISIMQSECFVDGRRISIEDGVELYGLNMLRALGDGRIKAPEVRLE